jgi:predicted GIY-YIG superfamily endonuclease
LRREATIKALTRRQKEALIRLPDEEDLFDATMASHE